MSVLFFNPMRFNKTKPKDPGNDRIILSNSNALPMIYAAWAEAGYTKDEDLRMVIRSDVEGPAPLLTVVDVSLGTLEQGVSVAVGMAYVRQFIDASLYWVYCVVVDASLADPCIWEALKFAGHYKLRKFVVVFDLNGDQILDKAQEMSKILSSYGYSTSVADGHNCEVLTQAFHQAYVDDEKFHRPSAIICKTIKGAHFPGYENKSDFHGKIFEKAEAHALITHVTSLHRKTGEHDIYDLISDKQSTDFPIELPRLGVAQRPEYSVGELVSTFKAFETSYLKLSGKIKRAVYLVGNDTDTRGSILSVSSLQDRFIADHTGDNVVGIGIGMACRNRTIPFVSASAESLVRIFDQVIMGANSKLSLNCVGSHAGVFLRDTGTARPVLDDLAHFCSIPGGATVFYPSDAVSCDYAVGLAATTKGICYIRTMSVGYPVLYEKRDSFKIGQAHVIRQSLKDQVLLIGVGATVHEALKAAKELETFDISARVLDPFTIKPLDRQGVVTNTMACGRRIITIEDHQSRGGLAQAVREIMGSINAIECRSLYMTNEETDFKSKTSEELLTLYGIDSSSIVRAAKELILKVEVKIEVKVEACTDPVPVAPDIKAA